MVAAWRDRSMERLFAALRLELICATVGLVASMIAADGAAAQAPTEPPATVALPRSTEKPPEPPNIDQLFDSSQQRELMKKTLTKGQTSFHISNCAGGDKACNDQLGHYGRYLYTRLRGCWQPRAGTAVAAAFWFGKETAADRHDAPAPGDVSIRFQLTRDGHVAGTPWSTALATSDAISAEVIDALRRCQPYETPSDRFETWKDALMRIQIRAPGDKTAFHKF